MGNCLCKKRIAASAKLEDVKEIISDWSILQENKKYVDQFLKTISVDYSSQEIQDIQEAVVELLTRYKDKINESEQYNISRIEPCGSMHERTSIWKCRGFRFDTGKQFMIYTEFDYLNVLEKPCRYEIDINPRKCCAEVQKSDIVKSCSCEVSNCSFVIKPDDPGKFDRAFKDELCKSVESLCNCYCMYRHEKSYRYHFRQKSTEQQQPGCDKCIVYKPTGQLQIDTLTEDTDPPPGYSLKLIWTSYAMTLVAPNGDITDEIKTTSPIKHLPILIDFLPALEVVNTQKNEGKLEHECFFVPKWCCLHYRTWRLSCCAREIDHIVNKMSEKHRKCYKILKYICDQRKGMYSRKVPSYDVKTAALNHSMTCKNSSEDYRNCVTAVLEEIKIAYEREVLKSFCYKFNLLQGSYWRP